MDERKKTRISLMDTYRSVVSGITDDHVLYMQVILAAILGLIILYVFSRRVLRSVSGKSVVLVGGCEAGKTALFYTLLQGKMPLTATSFKENLATYTTGKKSIRLVDVPGHERVRATAFDRHKSDARAIVFLLDSTTLHQRVRDVAEQLFSVLTDEVVQRSGCPVAVVCNKQDKELAKAAPVIERELERELEVLRETSSSRLASTSGGGGASSQKLLGSQSSSPFRFSGLSCNSVTFIESSVADQDQLDHLKTWLTQVA